MEVAYIRGAYNRNKTSFSKQALAEHFDRNRVIMKQIQGKVRRGFYSRECLNPGGLMYYLV